MGSNFLEIYVVSHSDLTSGILTISSSMNNSTGYLTLFSLSPETWIERIAMFMSMKKLR